MPFDYDRCAYTAFRVEAWTCDGSLLGFSVTLEVQEASPLPRLYMRLVRYMKRQARRYS